MAAVRCGFAEPRESHRIIAGTEKTQTETGVILTEPVDEYIERHEETLELLANPEWVELIGQGKREVEQGVKGRTLDELDD